MQFLTDLHVCIWYTWKSLVKILNKKLYFLRLSPNIKRTSANKSKTNVSWQNGISLTSLSPVWSNTAWHQCIGVKVEEVVLQPKLRCGGKVTTWSCFSSNQKKLPQTLKIHSIWVNFKGLRMLSNLLWFLDTMSITFWAIM